jgi:hypothetical protein
MLEDHKKLLHPDCKQDHTKLGITLELLQWKAKDGITNKGFEELLGIVKNMLPEGNELPSTIYEAKNVVCPLGLDVQRIHACPNDCILYLSVKYEKLDVYPLCMVEPLELFQLKCASHHYTGDTNSTHFKRNNPLVCRVTA